MRPQLLVGLLLSAITISLGMSLEREEWSTGDPLDEEKLQSNCPEYCTCGRQPGDGVIAQCDRITPTQRFSNLITTFFMVRNENQPLTQTLTLDEKFFLNLQLKSVDTITILDIDIETIDKNAFRGLNVLTQVNLTNNNLKTLLPDTFVTSLHLQRLCLSRNPLTFAQNQVVPYILRIPNLVELDLSSCHLYNILPTTLSTLNLLSYLNLASNFISNVDPRTFSNLTSLEEINLSNNNIQSLNPDLFKTNSYLSVVDLSNNPLVSVESLILPGLTGLDLSFCLFTKVGANSFVGFPALLKLNLSSNAITDVDVNALSKLEHLEHLDLSNNSFAGQLDAKIFLQNEKIETINLRNNPKMSKLPDTGFEGKFTDLYKLDVSNCGLEILCPGTFTNMPNLAHLYLSNNSINTIKSGVINRKIKHLSLAYNKITSLNDLHFPPELQLHQLFLQGNNIKQLSPENFINMPYLTKLDLSSCNMEQIWSDFNETMPYLKSLRKLNLSKNKLTKISPQDLAMFSSLNSLDIMSNPLSCNTEDLQALVSYMQDMHIDPYDLEGTKAIPSKFEWSDIWGASCKDQSSMQIKQGSPTDHVQSVEIDSYDYHDDVYYNYDMDDDDDDHDEGKSDDENSTQDRRDGIPTEPKLIESSYQLGVMAVAAAATFFSILLLVVILKLCKQRLCKHREVSAQRRRGDTMMIYKPLFDNEHANTPTSPIIKQRAIPIGSEANNNASNEEIAPSEYSQTVGHVTYLSGPFHDSVLGPDRIV